MHVRTLGFSQTVLRGSCLLQRRIFTVFTACTKQELYKAARFTDALRPWLRMHGWARQPGCVTESEQKCVAVPSASTVTF